jgi:hypothetical protein
LHYKENDSNDKNLIHLPRQVVMANEQYFVHFGRTGQVGLVGKRETTK